MAEYSSALNPPALYQSSNAEFNEAEFSRGGFIGLTMARKRRRSKRSKRMRGSGRKCNCGPRCSTCKKYKCKGKRCKCTPGCGKKRSKRRSRRKRSARY